jgi:excisionase family DNA binding protein
MSGDLVLIPLPGIGTLALSGEAFAAALAAGAGAIVAPVPSPHEHGADEPLLEAEELATALNLPTSWVEAAARSGKIPSVKAGRWRRFNRRAVERALEPGRNTDPKTATPPASAKGGGVSFGSTSGDHRRDKSTGGRTRPANPSHLD